jgi:hypothetical protein
MRPVRRFHDRARRYGFTVAARQVSRRHHIQVIGPASNAQGHQDRREKRQRVHASFQRVLTAANMLAAITAPLQRGSSGAWTPEQHMTKEDRSRFYQTLETLIEGLRQAAVDLRLEGLSEPVAAVDELAIRFDFRWHRKGASRPTATEEDSRVAAEAAQAIAAIRERLESQLPAILDDILPVSRKRGWPWRQRSS